MTEIPTKHVPERTCVVCRKKRPQAELLRFARDIQGIWQMDSTTGKIRRTGRGVYLCASSMACADEKKLRRTFGTQSAAVAQQVRTYHQLDQELQSGTAPTGVTG